MKKDEKRVLDTFSDARTAINPKFKKNLRSRIIWKSSKKAGLKWPRLVLVPAFALLALVVVFAGIQKPHFGKGIFVSEKVSAQELIEKSDAAVSNFDPSKYTYFVSTYTAHGGPWFDGCAVGIGSDNHEYVSHTYVYRDLDGGVEAMYTDSMEDGVPGRTVSVYDDSSRKIVEDFVIPRGTSLSQYLHADKVAGKPGFFVVDKEGNRLPYDSIKKTILNGRSVYSFYTRLNTDVVSPLQCWPAGSNRSPKAATGTYLPPVIKSDITKIVIDARTFETIEYAQYVDRVSEKNLVIRSSYAYTAENIRAETALAEMSKAGFNKDTALHEMPGGHD